ncbi:hypothetical protein V6N13_135949 [Hibiscus sabdariffa]
MFPSSALVGQNKEESIAALPIDDLIEKSTITRSRLQARKHICVMTGGGVNDDPALKKAGIGIAVADANGAARSASDIILTEPGPSVIISAVLTSQAISQRMTNYTIYAISITVHIMLGFMLLALIWQFDFPSFMVIGPHLIIAILNNGIWRLGWRDMALQPSLLLSTPLHQVLHPIRPHWKGLGSVIEQRIAFTRKKDLGK